MNRNHFSPGVLALGGAALLAVASPAAGGAVEHVMTVTGWSDGIAFTNPRGIAIDPRRGDVVVANTSAHRVEVFSPSGRPLQRITCRVRTPEGVDNDGYPNSVAIDRAGRLLIADNLAAYVDVLSPRGRPVARLELPNDGRPVAVAVAPDGAIVVAGAGPEGRIHEFGPDFVLRKTWGVAGRAAGQLAEIRAIAVTTGGQIVVLSPATEHIVQLFTRDGDFVRGFGRIEIGAENFSLPSGVAVTDDGRIWITDEIRQRIQVYQPDGQFLEAIAGGDAGASDFLYPSAIATDGHNHLAVVERVAGRYRLLRLHPSSQNAQP